jgi:putative cofactor-binding repeat protein
MSMHKKLWLVVLVGALLWSAAPAMADGDIYVIAGGGAAGTRIASLPCTISNPGFYYVASNLTCASGHGITVSANDVTIDLMGFRLSGNATSSGITFPNLDPKNNLEIRNGTLTGWYNGIFADGGNNCRFINLRVESNNNCGVVLSGYGHLIKGCTISDNNYNYGIYLAGSGTISNNIVITNSYGIYVNADTGLRYALISGNLVSNAFTHIYLSGPGSIIGNTIVTQASQTGIDLSAATPSNPLAILVDQNTAGGAGTPITPVTPTTGSGLVYGKNAGITSTP